MTQKKCEHPHTTAPVDAFVESSLPKKKTKLMNFERNKKFSSTLI
jgi:hypothetical protein